MDPRPRRVVVTGATGLLGSAICHALAARGDAPVLVGRRRAELLALASDVGRRAGPGASTASSASSPSLALAADTVVADLADPASMGAVADAIRATGPVDALVLAAGSFSRTPLAGLDPGALDDAMRVHAFSPLLLVRALEGDLRAASGAVVGLGDAGVARPFPNHVAYLAAKGALDAGLRALAVELAPGVRINVVAPGVVADPEAALDAAPDARRAARLAARSTLGRFGTPGEVVHVVLSLLDATWTTGETWGVGR